MRTKVLGAMALLLLGSLIGGGAWAGAQRLRLISSRDIRDRSIQNRDISPGVITLNRLTRRVQALIRQQGPAGAPGQPGQPGQPGAPGQPGTSAPTLTSGGFGIINRNSFGSPQAQLRSGPNDPPAGNGSLNLLVDGAPRFTSIDQVEKVAYGETMHGRLSELDQVGFAVDNTAANVQAAQDNMPGIQLEINPHRNGITFSTLTFNPVGTPANHWTTIDATDPASGGWSLTGAAGTLTGCSSPGATTGCTLARIKTELPDATIFTVMVNKGRDFAWKGAVDALRVNGRIADFEEFGVVIRNA